jgi:hypothetical protein
VTIKGPFNNTLDKLKNIREVIVTLKLKGNVIYTFQFYNTPLERINAEGRFINFAKITK